MIFLAATYLSNESNTDLPKYWCNAMIKLILITNYVLVKDLKFSFGHRFTPENEFISHTENFKTHIRHHDAYFDGFVRIFKAQLCGVRIFQIITRYMLISKHN